MVAYLTVHFENTEVCDALIREWKAGCTKKLKKRKRTRDQIQAIIHEAKSEVKLEILTLNEIKIKVLKGFYYHQEITKTKAQEITPRIIVKNTIKRKETYFQKIDQLQKTLRSS